MPNEVYDPSLPPGTRQYDFATATFRVGPMYVPGGGRQTYDPTSGAGPSYADVTRAQLLNAQKVGALGAEYGAMLPSQLFQAYGVGLPGPFESRPWTTARDQGMNQPSVAPQQPGMRPMTAPRDQQQPSMFAPYWRAWGAPQIETQPSMFRQSGYARDQRQMNPSMSMPNWFYGSR